MATHSSILAWEIPWTEEPGGQSMGSQSDPKESNITECILICTCTHIHTDTRGN